MTIPASQCINQNVHAVESVCQVRFGVDAVIQDGYLSVQLIAAETFSP